MESKKLAYVVHGERPLNGILENQVFKLYDAFALDNVNFSVTIYLLAHPLIYIKLFKDYRKLKRNLRDKKIILKVIPLILIPERWESYGVFLTKLSFYINILCYILISFEEFNIIICRSYVASYNMCKVKQLLTLKSDIIFDPRSVFPLERKSFEFFRSEKLYQFWIEREKYICNAVSKIIYISEGMKEYYISLNIMFEPKMVYLPLCYDIPASSKNNEISKKIDDKINLLYIGSMNIGMHNNDINHYLNRCKEILILNKLVNFIFVFPKVSIDIKQLFYSDPIFDGKVEFYEGKIEVEFWLKKANFGIYFLKEALDSNTRYGVKSVEYLCNGLPIIFDSGAGGIGDVAIKNNLGINISDSIKIINLNTLYFDNSNIAQWARKEHSIDSNLKRLKSIVNF